MSERDYRDEYREMDKSRLVFLGDHRCYRVFKHAVTGEYWTTYLLDGDFAFHGIENPLPR